jgi:ABC-type phosphate transport system substrate-binding protein
MKFVKDNFAYIILGAVALILIFITISLQASILSTQTPSAGDTGLLTSLRQQLASWILPEAVESSPGAASGAASATTPGNNDAVAGGTAGEPLEIDSTAPDPAIAGAAPLGLSGSAALLYSAANLTVSEDDEILATIISNDRLAVGFFGYAYYLAHQDRLRTVALRLPDGQLVGPNATSVANGLYPLARPLYLYTSPTVLRDKPEVERFIGCYLNQLPPLVSEVGYLLPSRALFDQAMQSFNASCQRCRREATTDHPLANTIPACDLSDSTGGSITIVGSSTVQPLSDRMARMFTERGFTGTIEVDGSGTSAGFRNFCNEASGDIVDASRPIKAEERARCTASNRAVIPFPVAVDALAIVVSRDNTFLQEASIAELQQIFAYAGRWSDVNPAWPNEPIQRAIPGAQSGTFDYFVEAVIDGQALETLAANQANPLSIGALPPGAFSTSTPTSVPVGSGAFIDNQPAVRLGYVASDDLCTSNTQLAALVLTRKFGLQVSTTAFPDIDTLLKALSAKETSERVDLTFCYSDPADRSYRQRYFSYTEFIGSGYQKRATERYVIMSNSTVKAPLERGNACLYRFLTRLNWDNLDVTGQDLSSWYEENAPLIDSWTSCD